MPSIPEQLQPKPGTSRLICALVLIVGLCLSLSQPAEAQDADAVNKPQTDDERRAKARDIAEDIIESLTRRSSLPRVRVQARLDAADVDVCRELAERMENMSRPVVEALIRSVLKSSNPRAHAILALALLEKDGSFSQRCLPALSDLRLEELYALRGTVRSLRPDALERLSKAKGWKKAIPKIVDELCVFHDDPKRDSELRRRQLAFAMIVDLLDAENGFQTILQRLIELYASNENDAVSVAVMEDVPAEADEERSEPVAVTEARERRLASVWMLERVLCVDVEIHFFLNRSFGHERRLQVKEQFLSNVARLATDGEHENFADSGLNYRKYLDALTRVVTDDEQIRAYVVQDEFCGGVRIERPESEKKKSAENEEKGDGNELKLNEGDNKIPVFEGDNVAKKIENFKSIEDRRRGQRPRKRAVRREYHKRFLSND